MPKTQKYKIDLHGHRRCSASRIQHINLLVSTRWLLKELCAYDCQPNTRSLFTFELYQKLYTVVNCSQFWTVQLRVRSFSSQRICSQCCIQHTTWEKDSVCFYEEYRKYCNTNTVSLDMKYWLIEKINKILCVTHVLGNSYSRSVYYTVHRITYWYRLPQLAGLLEHCIWLW